MASTTTVISKGRQKKIEIKPINDKSKKHVTFSKRRKGLFNKIEALCSLTNSQACIVAISGAGKVYSFGNPGADSVVHRYLDSAGNNSDSNEHRGRVLWDEPIEELGLDELKQLKVGLEALRDQAASRLVDEERNGNRGFTEVENEDFYLDLDSIDSDSVSQGLKELGDQVAAPLDDEKTGLSETEGSNLDLDSIDWVDVPQTFGCSSDMLLGDDYLHPLLEDEDSGSLSPAR